MNIETLRLANREDYQLIHDYMSTEPISASSYIINLLNSDCSNKSMEFVTESQAEILVKIIKSTEFPNSIRTNLVNAFIAFPICSLNRKFHRSSAIFTIFRLLFEDNINLAIFELKEVINFPKKYQPELNPADFCITVSTATIGINAFNFLSQSTRNNVIELKSLLRKTENTIDVNPIYMTFKSRLLETALNTEDAPKELEGWHEIN